MVTTRPRVLPLDRHGVTSRASHCKGATCVVGCRMHELIKEMEEHVAALPQPTTAAALPKKRKAQVRGRAVSSACPGLSASVRSASCGVLP